MAIEVLPRAAARLADAVRQPDKTLAEPAAHPAADKAGASAAASTEPGLEDFPRDPIGTLRQLHQMHGDLACVRSPQRQATFVFSPELNQQVLTQPDRFHSLAVLYPGPRRSAQRRLAMSLVAANGEDYKRRRRVMLEPMKKILLPSYLGDVVGLTSQMLRDWQVGQTRDVHHEMHQLMLRVTSGILFGLDRPDMALDAGLLLDRFLMTDSRVGRPGVARLDNDPAVYDRLLELAEQLEARIQQLIDYRRTAGMGRDVLSRLLQASQGQSGAVCDSEMIGDVAFLFGAAHKTTASALAWTLFLLSQHPWIARQVEREIGGVLHGQPPTVERLAKLELLDRVVKESLRLLPPVVCMARQCQEATELEGQLLPAGSLVMLSQFITHRRPELYGHADSFCPDRWLRIQPSPYEYFPYSAGQRRCLGASFADLVLKTSLAMILGRYRPAMLAEARVDRQVTLVLEPKAGLPMRIGSAREPYRSFPVRGDIHDLVALPMPGSERLARQPGAQRMRAA
ncbi:MAG: cytochrome P450 [Pirellulaceae bacterium]|nr:cytochrome P450 [Pirellulaceae bacterium]